MVQGGDIINGDGSGGESIYGPTFEDENFTLTHESGALSMANKGSANTNGSQFCITTEACAHLDGTNVVFGRVLAGLKVAEEMEAYAAPEAEGHGPTVDCVIEDCGELKDYGRKDICCRDGTTDQLPEYPEDYDTAYAVSLEELIDSVKDVKNAGNQYFGRSQYKAATRKYLKCLRYMELVKKRIDKLEDEQKESLHERQCTFILQCNLNLAACYRYLEDYKNSIRCCTEVLKIEPRNDKALYRRGQANYALKNFDAALSDLRQAEKISPNSKAIQKLMDEVKSTNKNYIDLQRQRLSKFFREQTEKVAF